MPMQPNSTQKEDQDIVWSAGSTFTTSVPQYDPASSTQDRRMSVGGNDGEGGEFYKRLQAQSHGAADSARRFSQQYQHESFFRKLFWDKS